MRSSSVSNTGSGDLYISDYSLIIKINNILLIQNS